MIGEIAGPLSPLHPAESVWVRRTWLPCTHTSFRPAESGFGVDGALDVVSKPTSGNERPVSGGLYKAPGCRSMAIGCEATAMMVASCSFAQRRILRHERPASPKTPKFKRLKERDKGPSSG